MKRPPSNRGSALLASLIILTLVLACSVQLCNWVMQSTRVNVKQIASQKAMINSDSGLEMALQYLKTPEAAGLPAGIPIQTTQVAYGTTYYLEYTRQVADPSLIVVVSSGYFALQNGNEVLADGQHYQRVSVSAQIQLRSVGEYLAATPGSLLINYGSNISSGIVYAKDLIFVRGSSQPQTIMKGAYYLDSITPGDFANFVTFVDPGHPVRLTHAPVLSLLGASMRQRYQSMAGSDIIPAGTVLQGDRGSPANSYKVYFVPGDVTLGAATPVNVTESFLIYSTGDIHIKNSITTMFGRTAWPALLAEGNIIIDDDAPVDLTLQATMLTNGDLMALGSHPGGRLHITGGMVSQGEINLASAYLLQREYVYQAPDLNLPLPNTCRVVMYKVLSGKYTR